MAVVGPSGRGQDDAVERADRLPPRRRGQILYGGRDLYDDYDELRTRIGFVPQPDVVHDTLTVQQALEYAGELRFAPDVLRDERSARIDPVLARRADHEVGSGTVRQVEVSSDRAPRRSCPGLRSLGGDGPHRVDDLARPP